LYVSLVLGMEHLVGVDLLMENVARCYQYTSSDDDPDQLALTGEDWGAGKRPMSSRPLCGGDAPSETAQGPLTTPSSPVGAPAPKHR